MVETVFDTLNAKAALKAIEGACRKINRIIPIMISATITDLSGRTLSGQTIEAFYNSIIHVNPLSVGLNCALGPKELEPYIIELDRISESFISVHPNAGLPNELGEFDESPGHMATVIADYVENNFINIVGGCCGTTPKHIEAIADVVSGQSPRTIPDIEPGCRLAGLEAFNITKNSLFVNIGERCNITGSAKFKNMILIGYIPVHLELFHIGI